MFLYDGSDQRIIDAVKVANDPRLFKDLLKLIGEKEFFDMSDASPLELRIEFNVFMNTTTVNIKTYKAAFWSRAIAMFKRSDINSIYLNTRKLNRSTASIVGTCFHEAGHACDAVSDFTFNHGYGYGSNSPIGKENTFQYWIGNRAKELVSSLNL